MTTENKNPFKSVWTDTKGLAEYYKLNPATIRKQRSKQMKNIFPFHRVGGAIRYNLIKCEKFMEANKNAYE